MKRVIQEKNLDYKEVIKWKIQMAGDFQITIMVQRMD